MIKTFHQPSTHKQLSYQECLGTQTIERDYFADRYWVGGTNTWNSTAGTKWSATSGGAGGASVPTNADEVYFDVNSTGVCTLSTTSTCRRIDTTGIAGSITHPGSVTLSIGDGTAATGNVALKFDSAMTYTIGSATSSIIAFVRAPSATAQTIDFGGKTTGNVNIGTGFSALDKWKVTNGHVTGATSTVTMSAGDLDWDGQTINIGLMAFSGSTAKTLRPGSASITITGTGTAWNCATATNTTITANTSTITMTGSGTTMLPGSPTTYNNVVMNGANQAQMNGNLFCVNFTRTGTAAKTDLLNIIASAIITCSGTFACNGNSITNRMVIYCSNFAGTRRTITAAVVSITNTDIQDMQGAGAGNWDLSAVSGGSGDCGGNAGITFTTAAPQIATMSTNKNWDDVTIWTSRIPLPQDNVSLSGMTGGVLSANMARLCKDLDGTGASGGSSIAFPTAWEIFGSVNLTDILIGSGAGNGVLRGRGTHTIISAGKSLSNGNVLINAPGATYTIQDALTVGPSKNFSLVYGGFNSNNFTVSCGRFDSSNANVRSLTMGSSTWLLTDTAAVTLWNISTLTNLTFSGASSTITVANASASTRVVAFGNFGTLTYGTFNYTVAGSTGQLTVSKDGSPYCLINNFNFSDANNARTLKFNDLGALQFGVFNVQGTAGNLMIIDTLTASTHALVKSSGVVYVDYCAIKNSSASGGATWLAGPNCTDLGGNSGWAFVTAKEVADTGLGDDGSLGGYAYYRAITVDNTKVSGGADLTDFPMLVDITDSTLRTVANGGHVVDGNDIRFCSSVNITDLLSFEVESYNAVTGRLIAWVKIPTLTYATAKTIYLFYGKTGAANGESASSVWSSSYKGVYHLNQDPAGAAPQITDKSGTGNHGTTNGSMSSGQLVTGKIGNNVSLDGSDDYIDLGVTPSLLVYPLTISAWIKTTSTANDPGIVSNYNFGDGYNLFMRSGKARAWYFFDGSNNTYDGGFGIETPLINDGNYHKVDFVTDAAGSRIYADGVLADSQAWNGTPQATVAATSTKIGNYILSANKLLAQIDQVTFANAARTAGWLTTEYNNQNNPSTFYTVGEEYQTASLAILITAMPTIADSGSGIDAITSFISFVVSELGAGSEAISLMIDFLINDVGSGSEQATIQNTFSVEDSGYSQEDVTLAISLAIADIGAGVDIVRLRTRPWYRVLSTVFSQKRNTEWYIPSP